MVETNPNSFLNVNAPEVDSLSVESPTVISPTVASPTVQSPFDMVSDSGLEPGPFSPFNIDDNEDVESWFDSRRRKKEELKQQQSQEASDTIRGIIEDDEGFVDTLEGIQERAENIKDAYEKITTKDFTKLIEDTYGTSGSATQEIIDALKPASVGGLGLVPGEFSYRPPVPGTGQSGVFIQPLPPIEGTAPPSYEIPTSFEPTPVGTDLAEQAAQRRTAQDVLAKSASVVASIAAIDAFIDDPNLETGLYATAATATAAAAFGSTMGASIASVANPISLFVAGTQIFRALTRDVDYRRSQGYVTYENGQFTTSKVRGADAGTKQWAEAQTKIASETLNSLINDYGFEVDESQLGGEFGKKSLIMNNVQYGQRMGGRNASLTGSELILTALRQGTLKPTENTPDNISATPEDFSKFMGDTINKMNDDYATYIWDNYDGSADGYRTGRGSNAKYVSSTAAFGTEKGAKDYVASKTDDIKSTSGKRVEHKRMGKARTVTETYYTRTEYSYEGEKDHEVLRGAVYQGGHGISKKTYQYALQSGSYSKSEALEKIKDLNASSKPYDYTYKVRRGKGYRSATGQKKKVYQVLYIDGQYRVGEREQIL